MLEINNSSECLYVAYASCIERFKFELCYIIRATSHRIADDDDDDDHDEWKEKKAPYFCFHHAFISMCHKKLFQWQITIFAFLAALYTYLRECVLYATNCEAKNIVYERDTEIFLLRTIAVE